MTGTDGHGCVFCEIVARQRPAHIIVDHDLVVAFLDAHPLFRGHTLVVPRVHHETLGDLPHGLIEPLFSMVQRLGAAVERATEAHGTLLAVNNRVSQSVAHLHVHVVPRRFKDGLRGFLWPRGRYDDDADAAAMAGSIRSEIERD